MSSNVDYLKLKSCGLFSSEYEALDQNESVVANLRGMFFLTFKVDQCSFKFKTLGIFSSDWILESDQGECVTFVHSGWFLKRVTADFGSRSIELSASGWGANYDLSELGAPIGNLEFQGSFFKWPVLRSQVGLPTEIAIALCWLVHVRRRNRAAASSLV